jgi:hypothetical protein
VSENSLTLEVNFCDGVLASAVFPGTLSPVNARGWPGLHAWFSNETFKQGRVMTDRVKNLENKQNSA